MSIHAVLKPIARASDAINAWLTKAGGIAVTLAVVMFIGLMIVPTSPMVMDVLIGANIAIAITILLVALYISDAMRLPSFPAILLVTTLFRLSLNVSSTRLILTEGDAGEIINAFGEFVVGGNFVVGAVIFLIITIIQFVVITKGAERVAEVAARFTLDAMPGKQMAIDADLRASLLSPVEAQLRRRRLENENKLYGAMDGAMKFVKGDAIAGIIISLVNVIGGLVIGHMQMGMSLADAATKFTLLSIGDGLVSQVPALLICVAAGLVVTRVASSLDQDSGEQDGYAGKEIVDQILGQPTALVCVAGMLALLAILPTGLPWPVFLTLSVLFALIAVPQLPLFRAGLALADAGAVGQPSALARGGGKQVCDSDRDPAGKSQPISLYPTPVLIQLGSAIAATMLPKRAALQNEVVQNAFDELQKSLEADLGVRFPPIRVQPAMNLAANDYEIRVFDCPVAGGAIAPDDVLLPCHEKEARRVGLTVRPFAVPWNHAAGCLVRSEDFADAHAIGLRPIRAADVVSQHTLCIMRRHAAEFVGVQETQLILDRLDKHLPELKAAVQKVLTLPQIATVLQRLLAEEVPVRNVRLIFDTLARLGTTIKHPLDLAEAVRRAMGRALCHRFARAGVTLHYLRLADEIEALVSAGRRVTADDGVATVTIRNQDRVAIRAAVNLALASCAHLNQTPVILTSAELRPFVRAMLVQSHPQIVVLSDAEAASATVQIEWCGDIVVPA